ncbi:MAG: HAD family phosphatase [Crocinitomicaceae bacterium]|nr:HAD family phosphatase [Crocinitomicaceae bacterium]
MNLDNIEAIIFDLGGVLINLNYQTTIDQFTELGINNFESLYSKKQQSNLFDDYETGQISSQGFINTLLKHLPQGTSPNQVVSAWNSMILNIPNSSIKLLDKLSSKYRLFMLSNTNDIHFQKVYNEWMKTTDREPKSYFEKIYLSQEIGMRKPNPEIFKHVCEEQNLNASTTLFIDDSIQHIEGAKSIGLNVHHLSNITSLDSLFS